MLTALYGRKGHKKLLGKLKKLESQPQQSDLCSEQRAAYNVTTNELMNDERNQDRTCVTVHRQTKA